MLAQSDARTQIERTLHGYASLDPGWDGYDGVVPAPGAIEEAVSFVRLLPSGVPLPEPMVAGDGEVGVFWKLRDAFIDVSFRGRGVMSYYARPAESGRPVLGDVPFSGRELPHDLLVVIRSLKGR